MGTESSSDPIVMQSCIALLQGRFRQLQRMKERREEKELSRKLMPEAKQFLPISTSIQHEPTTAGFWFFHPDDEFILEPMRSMGPSCALSLSLWPTTTPSKHGAFQCDKTPMLMSLWPQETPTDAMVMNKFDDANELDDDIDTSLHL